MANSKLNSKLTIQNLITPKLNYNPISETENYISKFSNKGKNLLKIYTNDIIKVAHNISKLFKLLSIIDDINITNNEVILKISKNMFISNNGCMVLINNGVYVNLSTHIHLNPKIDKNKNILNEVNNIEKKYYIENIINKKYKFSVNP